MVAKPKPKTAPPSAPSLRWEFRPPGTDYVMHDDEFTLDEVESIEEMTEVPWLLLHPGKSLKVARAMLAVACIRAGIPDEEIPERINTLHDLEGVLTLVPVRKGPLKAVKAVNGTTEAVPPTSASS